MHLSACRLGQAVKSLLRPASDAIELVVRIEDELTSTAPRSREHQIYVERDAEAISYVNTAVGEIDDWLFGLRSVGGGVRGARSVPTSFPA